MRLGINNVLTSGTRPRFEVWREYDEGKAR